MKKVLSLCVPILLIISLCSFSLLNNENAKLIGVWVYSGSEKEIRVYERSITFKSNKTGIEFMKNGKILKRQNVGWCGTPPISYGNYKGFWKLQSDSTLTINYEYWGGTAEMDWEIIELTTQNLKIKMTEHRTERKN